LSTRRDITGVSPVLGADMEFQRFRELFHRYAGIRLEDSKRCRKVPAKRRQGLSGPRLPQYFPGRMEKPGRIEQTKGAYQPRMEELQ
jgi:hypothetical protein